MVDYTSAEVQFNASLDTAEYVSGLRKHIADHIKNNDWEGAASILWSLNHEIIGWYSKHKKQTEIEKLEAFEKQIQVLAKSGGSNKELIFEQVVRKWTRCAIIECHKIWFSKEIDKNKVALMG